MATNNMTGYIYGSEDTKVDLKSLNNKLKTAKKHDQEPYLLSRGNIFKNENAVKGAENDVVIFEVDFLDTDAFSASFRGFLFNDQSINGKFKYPIDSGFKDETFTGTYKLNKTRLIVFGQWIEENNVVSNCFIELKIRN